MAKQHSLLDELAQALESLFSGWRSRRRKFAARQPIFAKALKIGIWVGAAFVAAMFALAVLVYLGAFGPLPNYATLRAIRSNTASQVYSDDGKMLGKYYLENRLLADYEDISSRVVLALVATEDARFFEHGGIDLRAWMRVLVKTILLQDESAGGGSTLSQQLAKNLFPRQHFPLVGVPVNKFREMFIARRLERLYTKEELLHLYLNTVPFSENVFGIKVAAERFFNTTPAKLRTEEAAVLIGMLKGTTAFNPVRHPERALERRNVVLSQMEKYGYLRPAACDSLKNLPIRLDYRPESKYQGLATYLREHIRLELLDILKDYPKTDGSPYNLYTDGLKIYTTIDSRLQEYAEEAVHEHLSKLQADFDKQWKGKPAWGSDKLLTYAMKNSDRYKNLKANGLSEAEIERDFRQPIQMTVFSWKQGSEERRMSPLDSIKYYLTLLHAGFLAMEPATGRVLAWVGGVDHRFFKYDHVKSRRQVGSTMKPVVCAASLLNDILPCDYLDNQHVSYPEYENWSPENADGRYGGVYSMEGALSNSVNTAMVELALNTGIDEVRSLAMQMGVASDIPAEPAIALGAVESSLLDMAGVYAAFANGGLRPEPFHLTRIETADGQVIVDFDKKRNTEFQRVLPEQTAAMMTRMLQTAVDSGTAKRLRWQFGLPGALAGKTGTTQNYSDGWFIGYNPHVVAAVWIGGELPQIHFRNMSSGQASNTALPVWGLFCRKATQNMAFQTWKVSTFPALTDSLALLMECPLYLDERPAPDEDLADRPGWRGLFSGFLGSDRDESTGDGSLSGKDETERTSSSATKSEESQRIERKNVRLENKRERQKRRQAFWDRFFGRDEQ
jgi:penicillin-binding protein 1A